MGTKEKNYYNKTKRTCQAILVLFGGGKRDRTADLLHAMQALSQLSYTPHAVLVIVTYVPAQPKKLLWLGLGEVASLGYSGGCFAPYMPLCVGFLAGGFSQIRIGYC